MVIRFSAPDVHGCPTGGYDAPPERSDRGSGYRSARSTWQIRRAKATNQDTQVQNPSRCEEPARPMCRYRRQPGRSHIVGESSATRINTRVTSDASPIVRGSAASVTQCEFGEHLVTYAAHLETSVRQGADHRFSHYPAQCLARFRHGRQTRPVQAARVDCERPTSSRWTSPTRGSNAGRESPLIGQNREIRRRRQAATTHEIRTSTIASQWRRRGTSARSATGFAHKAPEGVTTGRLRVVWLRHQGSGSVCSGPERPQRPSFGVTGRES